MLLDYRAQGGDRLRVEWPHWMFIVALDGKGDAMGFHDQDYIHNGKKLINPLFSIARTLMLGGFLCASQHLEMVYNHFLLKEDGLLQVDIYRKNRQN